MKDTHLTIRGFWRNAGLTAAALAGLVALQTAANVIYALPHGSFPASMIRVLRSRAATFNPGVEGYYQQLLSPAGGPHKRKFKTAEEYVRWANGSHDRIYTPDFRLSRLRPNLDRLFEGVPTEQPTNSFGFIGSEWSRRKSPNTRRMALLGDSVTQGMGVDLNHIYATLFQQLLNTTHPARTSERFEVLNFAVTSYTLTQIFDVAMDDAPRFEPDVYLLALTELGLAANWDAHLVQLIQLGIDPKYEFIRETLRKAKVSRGDDSAELFGKLEPYRIPLLKDMLAEMKSRAERGHAAFIVALVPSLEDGDLSKKRFSEIPGLLDSLHITYVDLLDTFDGISDPVPFRIQADNVHPNARGHAMIAQNLYNKLRANPAAWSALRGNAPETVRRAKASPTDKAFQVCEWNEADWPVGRSKASRGNCRTRSMPRCTLGLVRYKGT